jgi:O-antigen ligase
MSVYNITRLWTEDVRRPGTILVMVMLGLAPLFGWALARERWIILAGLTIVALSPVLLRWPVITTFGLYVFLLPFDVVGAEGMAFTRPVGILAGAVLVAAGLMERRLDRPPIAVLWWGLFVIWAALSAAWALSPEMVFQRLPTVVSLFFLYAIAVSIRPSRKEFYWICLLAVVGGAIIGAGTYLYGLEDATGRGTLVIGDQTANPNSLGGRLILPLALAIAGLVTLRGAIQRAIAMALLVLISVGVFISMSRAALLAVIAMISVLVYRIGLRKQIVAALVLLFAVAAIMPVTFYDRIGLVLTGEDATGSGRTEIWKVAVGALERFGILGAGLDNFVEVHRFYVVHGPSGYGSGAHNSYLMVWVELGAPGLALLLAALGSHFLVLRSARKAGRGGAVLAGLEAACVGVLTFGFFGDVLWQKDFWLAWILLSWGTFCAEQSDVQRSSSEFDTNDRQAFNVPYMSEPSDERI